MIIVYGFITYFIKAIYITFDIFSLIYIFYEYIISIIKQI
jgi:hypothetical protein